jgi:hypothetical protein
VVLVGEGLPLMYIYLAILIAGLLAGSTGAWQVQNWRHGAEQAIQDREDKARQETRDAAQQGAASAIAALKPVNTTIVQKVQHETQTNTVYRDCKLPATGLQLANQALTGRSPEPAGGDQLPAVVTPK